MRLEAAARAVAEANDHVTAVCAMSGIDLIITEDDQRKAAEAVLDCALAYGEDADGIIIGSFGDTGIELVRNRLDIPVVGIAEAAMRTALTFGPRPTIVSFSEAMRPSFEALMLRLEISPNEVALRLLPASPLPEAGKIADVLEADLLKLSRSAVRDGATCLVTGGGPLAGFAYKLRRAVGVPVIDGTEEAVKVLKSGGGSADRR